LRDIRRILRFPVLGEDMELPTGWVYDFPTSWLSPAFDDWDGVEFAEKKKT
jgi:hypothetical protein